DAAAAALPPEVADAFAPLRSVHRRLLEEPSAAEAPALLARGMEQVLSAPDPVLRAYPEDVRAGLLELALRPEIPSALSDRAAGALLATLPREGRTYPRLALRRAAQLLERHADDRARDVLDGLHRTRPDVHAAARWHAALEARRLGRVALAGELPAHGRLAPGFCLYGPPSTLVLADLDGVEQHAAADAAALHAPLAFALARVLVPSGGAGALAPEMANALARTLAEPRELCDLISVLDRVALRAGRA